MRQFMLVQKIGSGSAVRNLKKLRERAAKEIEDTGDIGLETLGDLIMYQALVSPEDGTLTAVLDSPLLHVAPNQQLSKSEQIDALLDPDQLEKEWLFLIAENEIRMSKLGNNQEDGAESPDGENPPASNGAASTGTSRDSEDLPDAGLSDPSERLHQIDQLIGLYQVKQRHTELREKRAEKQNSHLLLPPDEDMEKIHKHETTIKRQLHKDIDQLDKLQRRMRGEGEPPQINVDVST